jgi:ABC-type Zn uptake system ZnuABC Zn-binding protein ZnuA
MKRNTLKHLTLSMLTVFALVPIAASADAPVEVVASFSILGDLVQSVGGQRVQVTTLVGPDADAHTKAQFAALPAAQRKVITSHDAFGYFAAHYQIKFLAPEGINADATPSAKHVAGLIRQMKREKIKAVFVENMSNPKLITQLSKDAGATLGGTLYSDALSGPTEPGSSYLKMMQHNVTQLLAGMRLN